MGRAGLKTIGSRSSSKENWSRRPFSASAAKMATPLPDPMSEYRARAIPAVPPRVRQPLSLGHRLLPTRFFLAPLAGYTSLAFRLAVRGCGGLGLATTDLVNARSILERRRRAFELAETCDDDRPLSIQIYGQVIPEMCDAARWVVDQG